MIRVGFGVSVLARGTRTGGIDGIGVYTRALGAALARRGDVDLQAVSFGRAVDRASPLLRDSPLASLDVREGGRFAPRAVLSASLSMAFPGSRAWTRGLDVYHATDHCIPRLRDTPVVATLMDAIPLKHPEWVRVRARALKNRLWRHTASWAQSIVTISEHSRHEIIECFGVPEDRVEVVPLGVEPDRFGRLADDECQQVLSELGLQAPFFLFIGTIQPRKNVERIIAAHQRLPVSLRREMPLVLVGRHGWGCDELIRRLQALEPVARHSAALPAASVSAHVPGASDASVRWLRHVGDRQVQVLMQQAGALVFPSLHEGFGLPVLEAFASGLPVITSSTTALPEVAGDAALLVDPLDVDAIAAAMLRLSGDEGLRHRLREAGALRVREYTWERCAGRMVQVYRRVAEGGA